MVLASSFYMLIFFLCVKALAAHFSGDREFDPRWLEAYRNELTAGGAAVTTSEIEVAKTSKEIKAAIEESDLPTEKTSGHDASAIVERDQRPAVIRFNEGVFFFQAYEKQNIF